MFIITFKSHALKKNLEISLHCSKTISSMRGGADSSAMAAWISKKTCCPRQWGCGQELPETSQYFTPLTGKHAGYFNSYCKECAKAKRRKPKPIVEPYGPVKVCASKLGCGRSLRKSDFYGRQAACKSCYNARWVPDHTEKRRSKRDHEKLLIEGAHGDTYGRENSFTRDFKELSGPPGDSIGSERAMYQGFEVADSRVDGDELHLEVVRTSQLSSSFKRVSASTDLEFRGDPGIFHDV